MISVTEKLQGRSKQPSRIEGMRAFFPALLGRADGAVRAARARAGTVSICNVLLAINPPARIPRPAPCRSLVANVPQAPNIPGVGGGHGRGSEKEIMELAELELIEF